MTAGPGRVPSCYHCRDGVRENFVREVERNAGCGMPGTRRRGQVGEGTRPCGWCDVRWGLRGLAWGLIGIAVLVIVGQALTVIGNGMVVVATAGHDRLPWEVRSASTDWYMLCAAWCSALFLAASHRRR